MSKPFDLSDDIYTPRGRYLAQKYIHKVFDGKDPAEFPIPQHLASLSQAPGLHLIIPSEF